MTYILLFSGAFVGWNESADVYCLSHDIWRVIYLAFCCGDISSKSSVRGRKRSACEGEEDWFWEWGYLVPLFLHFMQLLEAGGRALLWQQWKYGSGNDTPTAAIIGTGIYLAWNACGMHMYCTHAHSSAYNIIMDFIYNRILSHTHTRTHTRTRTQTHTHTHSHAHAHMRVHTQTHTHAHTHTHTHTHTHRRIWNKRKEGS